MVYRMFRDRVHAGKLLSVEFGEKILSFDNVVIMAIPRGGVPVANEIAENLALPLDIFSVKKIGVPGNEELALGAVTEEGKAFYNGDIISHYGIDDIELNRITIKAQEKALHQAKVLRGGRKKAELKNKNVVLVDDGIATGATIKAAIQLLRLHAVKRILLTIPVCSQESWDELKDLVDDIYILDLPPRFVAVSRHYKYFPQVSDGEVIRILTRQIDKIEKPQEQHIHYKNI